MSGFLRALLSREVATYSSPSGHSYFTPDYLPLTFSSPEALPPDEGLLQDWCLEVTASDAFAWKQ